MMRETDVAIVGGGLAGSIAAAMLGRAGIATVLIDPHEVYPPDLRCEKIAAWQFDILNNPEIVLAAKRAATLDGGVWVSRFGRVIDRKPSDQYGLLYDTLVNTIRAEIPASVRFLRAKAMTVATSPAWQTVTLSGGETVSARLVVLANGLNNGLRRDLGLLRRVLSANHSTTVAFNLKPRGGGSFPFPGLTYYSEDIAAEMAYLTLFPIGDTMRANLMVYRDLEDPWMQRMRRTPEAALFELMPSLRAITGELEVEQPVKIRPVDLCVTAGHRQPGIVLVGDAFATSCPAAGTGTTKVFTDVGRLCNLHIPRWLATEGMGLEKIAQFYADPVKRACDADTIAQAFDLRSMSTDEGLGWLWRRWLRFLARGGIGLLRQYRPGEQLRGFRN